MTDWLKSGKTYNPYLTASVFARPFQLYGMYGEMLAARPAFQRANIYFIAENRKLRFVPEETTLDEDGNIKSVFYIANGERLNLAFNIPRLYFGEAMSNGFQSLILGVRNRKHYESVLSKHNLPITGISFNAAKSSTEALAFRLHLPQDVRELFILPHVVLNELGIDIGSSPKIIYIGQSRNLKKRTNAHEKIQQALAQASEDQDVYLYFFEFIEKKWLLDPTLEAFEDFKANVEPAPINDRQKINLVEMTLINYFKPRLNSTFVNSSITSNQQVENLLKANGYMRIVMEVSYDSPFWHFGSDVVPPQQEHAIVYELTS